MKSGLIITLLILWPNLLWLFFPPKDAPGKAQEQGDGRFLVILEWIGRLGVFVIPVFYAIEVESMVQGISLGIMAVALLVYYSGWARYFYRGRLYTLLFAPLMALPVPLAISPVLYFAAASVLLASWPLALATALLGATHIPISYRSYRALSGGPQSHNHSISHEPGR